MGTFKLPRYVITAISRWPIQGEVVIERPFLRQLVEVDKKAHVVSHAFDGGALLLKVFENTLHETERPLALDAFELYRFVSDF